MAAPATTAAEEGVENFSKSPHYKSPWQEEVDDAALTGNDGTEADITRLIAVDEEALLAEEEEDNELSISPRQDFLETLKLLASGGVAGAVSKSATAPLARLTILYQVCLFSLVILTITSRSPSFLATSTQLLTLTYLFSFSFQNYTGERSTATSRCCSFYSSYDSFASNFSPRSIKRSNTERRRKSSLEGQRRHNYTQTTVLRSEFLDL